MGVLEIIAEQSLGRNALRSQAGLRAALDRVEKTAQRSRVSADEKARIASLVGLCLAYERETDAGEKANILRTLEEISANEPLELPGETLQDWEQGIAATSPDFAKAKGRHEQRCQDFLRRYFSLRARAGLKTQQEVAKKAGLRRSYIAVIETGGHFPQQKTLQKLAKAFAVDVGELIP